MNRFPHLSPARPSALAFRVLSALVAAGLLSALGSGAAQAKFHVVTTLPNLAALAGAVGGDLVEVESIAKGYQDPHYVQARPSYAKTVSQADLLIANGLELEVGWLPLLLESGRNPKVRPGNAGFLDASTLIDHILEVPTGGVDRSKGDVHPYGNPHLDLDPRNGLKIAHGIAEKLAELDPANADTYRKHADAYCAQLQQKIDAWKSQAAVLEGKPIVGYHKEWEYLESWLGFHLDGYVEDRPGIPPSPRHLSELVDRMQADGVKLIIAAPYDDSKSCEGVGRKAGASVLILPTQVGAEDGIKTYDDLFETIVTRLVAGQASLQ
jgi:zinc/manganese transport system substrate-binding protein